MNHYQRIYSSISDENTPNIFGSTDERKQGYSTIFQDSPPSPPYNYDSSESSPKSTADWTISESPWLQIPSVEPPLSNVNSVGINEAESWNPFEQSENQIQNCSKKEALFPRPGNSSLEFSQSLHEKGYLNYVSHETNFPSNSLLNANALGGSKLHTKDNDTIPVPTANPAAASTSHDPPMESSWRASGHSRRTSTSSKSSLSSTNPVKRRYSSDQSISTHIESTPRLRSTQQLPPHNQISSSSAKTEMNTSKKARTNHNDVEKQYRHRLNIQFEALLHMLPREQIKHAADIKVSKAEVLALARRYIEDLEKKSKLLEVENRELESHVEEMEKSWSGFDEACVPYDERVLSSID